MSAPAQRAPDPRPKPIESSIDGPNPPRRTRRTTGEVVDRLMEAARQEFEAKGYAGATTAAIARRAKVAEGLLFNHFGSKAQLFKDTVVEPLNRHFETFLAEHPFMPEDAAGRRTASMRYVAELQAFMAGHARILLSLLFARSYHPDDLDGLAQVPGLQDYFARSARMAARHSDEQPAIDPAVFARLSFVSIMACTLFQDWVFPQGMISTDALRESIARFIIDGLNASRRAE